MPLATQFIAVRSKADIAAVAALAREIWDEYYVALIGQAQVDYMVAKFQSGEAIQEQIRGGYEYFLIQQQDASVGYLAVQVQPAQDSLFVSKLYLHRTTRGSGTGRTAMTFIEQLARERALRRLSLTVNKGNPAIAVYERLGFHVVEAIVMDIGNGFVMDDFRMEKALQDL